MTLAWRRRAALVFICPSSFRLVVIRTSETGKKSSISSGDEVESRPPAEEKNRHGCGPLLKARPCQWSRRYLGEDAAARSC